MYFLTVIFLLFVIFYQDLKNRSVSWIIFPFLLAGIFLWKSQQISNTLWINYSLINIGIVVIQLFIGWCYVAIKHKNLHFIDKYLGLGDILFWLVSAFLFSVVHWLILHLASLFFALIAHLLMSHFRKNKSISVPLAGLQAIFYSGVLLIGFISNYNAYNDEFLTNFLHFL